ncbi:hypothetical protein HAX54_008545, partial [Datura stramonium]|nr:hypothetical protein [Datura stramonium]
ATKGEGRRNANEGVYYVEFTHDSPHFGNVQSKSLNGSVVDLLGYGRHFTKVSNAPLCDS